MNIKYSIIALLCMTALWGCSKETITPETFGNINGQVLNSETEEGVGGVNITTSPATNSIITNQDGSFTLNEVTTGNYNITASKSDFESATVSVKVREGKTATAQIYLDPEDGNGEKSLTAQVTAWNERRVNVDSTGSDSTFADVEYEVTNSSDDTDIDEYEVYFKIYTTGETFSREEADTALAAGERNIAEFSKYVHQTTIDSVVVSGTYVE
ncbi:carboxypeptidase regulatory-like domain-containing protein [Fodinibius sp.]|uniref:carboxypeptidase regulatory-like domain-containing protein n=1 Tax=Fodinibius sp. TaxID=1872440 RepID=UPI002ACDBFEB|nr:carboxypeptidase regulatory-like domain-containing protein [Fodinibius sp.]